MKLYDDDVVSLDDEGITIKHYTNRRRLRHIPYSAVEQLDRIDLRLWTGKYRLVGISPGRPFHFFPWDPHRASKTEALAIDLGRRMRIAISPDNTDAVQQLIEERIG